MPFPNLIEAIARTNQPTLTGLRTRFPEEADKLLASGHLLGSKNSVSTSRSPASEASVALVVAGVETARTRIDNLLSFVFGRMRLATRIRLFGAIAAISAGLVSAALVLSPHSSEYGELVAACFSFVGGLVSILSDQAIRTPSGRIIASTEEHAKIIAMRVDVEQVALRLSRHSVQPLLQPEATAILDKLDKQLLQLIKYQESDIGR